MSKPGPWSAIEIAFIREHGTRMADRDIARQLGRSIDAVKKRRQILRLVEPGTRSEPNFTEHEDAVIRAEWQQATDVAIGKRIGRPAHAVRKRRMRLGLKRTPCRRWSAEEDEAIRAAVEDARARPYMDRCMQELAARLGRNISEVSSRTQRLGLSFRYIKQRQAEHRGRPMSMRDGERVFLHRDAMERHLGRPLRRGEHVHHVNLDKRNCDISNLFLCASASQHRRLHVQLEGFVTELFRRGVILFDRDQGIYRLCESHS